MATAFNAIEAGDSSGPNGRVIDVITFLAAHPTEAFTLSELASQLGLSNGSAHRVLTALADARFLSRHPKHKTYSLGMALVAIGQAALEKHRGIDVARREMAKVADELKVQCVATAIVDDELLFLAREGVPQTHDGLNRVGDRRPFVPPVGLGKIAWSDERTVEAYFQQAPLQMPRPVIDHMRRSLEVIRRRGFAVAGVGHALQDFRKATTLPIGQRRDAAYWAHLDDLIARLTPNETQLIDLSGADLVGVSHISAPVFAPNGTVALELTLSGMPLDLSVAEIERYASRLCAAAARITAETHGRMPQ